jgi:Protein of unknown function (DUF3175)
VITRTTVAKTEVGWHQQARDTMKQVLFIQGGGQGTHEGWDNKILESLERELGPDTDSTHPPPRTFSGSALQIARTMARKDVSPKGLGSAIRMIQYFINRGGRRLSASRRRELQRAKRILQRRRQAAG